MTPFLRSVPLCLLLAVTVACDSAQTFPRSTNAFDSEARADAPAASVLEVASYPQLTPLLTPLRMAIANAPYELSPDSGTLAADSALQRLRRDLEMEVASVVPEFNEQNFQADVWPSGAAGFAKWKQGERPQREATRDELALADSLSDLLEAHGIWVRRAEGDAYFSLHLPVLLESVGPYLTAGMRDFLAMEADEQRRPVAEDASLTITLEELTQRILWAEQFISSYPDALLVHEARAKHAQYLALYLDGLDNTPAFERESGRLRPQLVEHMSSFLRKHGRTESGKLVARYYEMLEQNDYKRTAASDSLVSTLAAGRTF